MLVRFLIYYYCCCSVAVLGLASPPLQVSLRSHWPSPPFVLEVIEAVAGVDPDAVMPFLSQELSGIIGMDTAPTDGQVYAAFRQSKFMQSQPGYSRTLIDLDLGVRAKTPLIQAHFQYYYSLVNVSHLADECEYSLFHAGKPYCSVQELKADFDADVRVQHPGLGHRYGVDLPSVLAFVDPSSKSFAGILADLVKLCDTSTSGFTLLWKPPKHHDDSPTYLSGYGVELALKSTEYKVVDDQKVEDSTEDDANKSVDSTPIHRYDFAQLKQLYPDRVSELDQFETKIIEDYDAVPRIRSLRTSELKDLGAKTISYIMKSPVPLTTLRHMLQDFPKFAALLSRQEVDREVAAEISANMRKELPEGVSFWVNGLPIDLSVTDLFGLIEALRLEAELVHGLKRAGFSTSQSIDLIANSGNDGEDSAGGGPEVYDTRQPWERPGHYKDKPEGAQSPVIWWNNMERDSRYSSWSSSMEHILLAEGQLPRVRKNLFHCLLAVDLLSPASIKIVLKSLDFITNNVPIRFGIVPIVAYSKAGPSTGERLARLFYYTIFNRGRKAASDLLKEIAGKVGDRNKVQASELLDYALAIFRTQGGHDEESVDVDSVAGKREVDDELDDAILAAAKLSSDLGLASFDEDFPSEGAMFVNGFFVELDERFENNLLSLIQQQLGYIQRMVYFQQITENTDIYDLFLKGPYVKARRNQYVVPSHKNPLRFIDTRTLDFSQKAAYFSRSGDKAVPLTIWVFAKLSDKSGNMAITEVLDFVLSDSKLAKEARVAVCSSSKAMIDDSAVQEISKQYSDHPEVQSVVKQWYNCYDEQLGNKMEHSSHVVVNGRIVGPFPDGYFFRKSDFELLLEMEWKRVQQINSRMLKMDFGTDGMREISDKVSMLTSAVYSTATKHVTLGSISALGTTVESLRRSTPYLNRFDKFTAIQLGSNEDAVLHFAAIVDPTLQASQKTLEILESLSSAFGKDASLRVYLSPSREMSEELPIKRLYRYAFSIRPEFDGAGNRIKAGLRFDGVPAEPLLTLGTDLPRAWVVMPVVSPHDLDNIKLSEVDQNRGITAQLELKHLLIEGHARDIRENYPPRGLQLILGTSSHPAASDTIVMANYGYYQLKAAPGVWNMQIRRGRSRQFYDLLSVDSQHGEILADRNTGNLQIVVSKFNGALLITRVQKKAGKEGQELLSEAATPEDDGDETEDLSAGSLWGTLMNNKFIQQAFGKWGSTKPQVQANSAVINVFSVASGHLYERFLRIMIISVLRHTKSTVKFWFIEDFLSPVFKDFLPMMAEKHGFQFQLVTYKWPKWLRYQTEKQRLIWGYKILFLDVLFPLSLEKVIFVDADQIVRADLKELIDLDLKGAPYGYTPFCDSRKEIEGFRFWKNGYWKDHLRGKPYHISALYVIDLKRFRLIAAGDRLRQHYQQVTADPNSLANLDQDLPNDMQDFIPIHSLPQDWLWCETWCDDASLKTAKTIDLCNNPMTKEPKLDRARRLLSEWTVYDQEAKKLYDEWRNGSSGSKTAGSNKKMKDEL